MMLTGIRKYLKEHPGEEFEQRMDRLVKQTPLPVFWLLGKTQSGKTSIVKFLTGAATAEIGRGFKPCTRFSQKYHFPGAEAPLLTFLDTRSLEEPGYDAADDLTAFNSQAHVVIVTVRVLDHALENLIKQLRKIRAAERHRPIVLALTCLHEAYPQSQHPAEYPFLHNGDVKESMRDMVPDELIRAIAWQREHFAGLCDFVVPIDLTPPQEEFKEPDFGGPQLTNVLIEALPAAYGQTLLKLEEATHTLREYYERRALPYIIAYSTMAGTAGAIPIPWLDLLILPGIQTRMIYSLAKVFAQPMSGQQFLELAGTMGLGMLVRQGIRELLKFIPVFGSIAGAGPGGIRDLCPRQSLLLLLRCRGQRPGSQNRGPQEVLSRATRHSREALAKGLTEGVAPCSAGALSFWRHCFLFPSWWCSVSAATTCGGPESASGRGGRSAPA